MTYNIARMNEVKVYLERWSRSIITTVKNYKLLKLGTLI